MSQKLITWTCLLKLKNQNKKFSQVIKNLQMKLLEVILIQIDQNQQINILIIQTKRNMIIRYRTIFLLHSLLNNRILTKNLS